MAFQTSSAIKIGGKIAAILSLTAYVGEGGSKPRQIFPGLIRGL